MYITVNVFFFTLGLFNSFTIALSRLCSGDIGQEETYSVQLPDKKRTVAAGRKRRERAQQHPEYVASPRRREVTVVS